MRIIDRRALRVPYNQHSYVRTQRQPEIVHDDVHMISSASRLVQVVWSITGRHLNGCIRLNLA